ncbi:unnamed protein product [Eruca vesicaria subsp. sativa]|uniref:F-box domain-containing protein n=1 Tax=Eruca vesicaria subsp. sativa TaxID=29727 RepID=A0ABC8IWG5_ERUVS|nr:unnamed protein product [Eruca vesicaria subsp. sativa]
MNRRVRQRVEEHGKDKVGGDEAVAPTVNQESKDWTSMANDIMLHVFTLLDSSDRASLASTCKPWRALGASPHLWTCLDIRSNKFDLSVAASLAGRCGDDLNKVRFRGLDSTAAICKLKAKNLKEIAADYCENLADATLSMIVSLHQDLESVQLGPGACESITSEAIKVIALCCPKLKMLRLSGVKDVTTKAIVSLATHCPLLTDVGFMDCQNIDEAALVKLVSVQYLSVSGTENMNWSVAAASLEKLPNLTGLDVSRTSINHATVSRLLNSSKSLKVVCAVNCPLLERSLEFNPDTFSGKLLIVLHNNTLNGMASLFEANSMMPKEAMHWLEWVLSHTLLLLAESNKLGVDSFWQKHGGKFFVRLMQSTQEDVQERAARGLAAFTQVGDDYAIIYSERAETVLQDGGIPILLKLAGSLKHGLQTEAAKAIAHLSLNADVAKAVDEEGGLKVLVGLAKSRNRLVAEEAAGALWNLSLGDPFKAIAEAGGVNVLVKLLSIWPYGYGRLLERVAGALANLAGDDKCSMEIGKAGGVHALVMLTQNCMYEGAQAQAARCLANLAIHDDGNINNDAIGLETGVLQTLLQLTKSNHVGLKQEAAGALWSLAYDDKNRELIAALGGVEVLVEFAKSCVNASSGLQENAAGALWALAHSEEHSMAIGEKGGIPPLILLARFNYEAVHETVAGALWNLSFNQNNALRIVEEDGVKMLVRLCTYSNSKWARFLSSLALAYIFDGRLDGFLRNTPPKVTLKRVYVADKRSALRCIESYIKTFMDQQIFETGDASSSTTPPMSAQDLENIRIQEADNLRCSSEEIGMFVTMLGNPSPVLKKFAAFVLLQFTIPGASHAKHHASLMQNRGDAIVLRSAADDTVNMPSEARDFVENVLSNLEHHQP